MSETTVEHSVWDIKYHLAWTTKSRGQILNNKIALRSRELIHDICAVHEAKIISGTIASDYIHIEVSSPPTMTPGHLATDLKDRIRQTLQDEFPALNQQYWGHSIWAVGYLCITGGPDAEQRLGEYLDSQKPSMPEDETIQVVPAP